MLNGPQSSYTADGRARRAVLEPGLDVPAMSPTILERDRISWLLPPTEAMEKNRKWAIGLTDCGMRPRPFWPHRNGDRGQWHPRSFERHRIAQLGDCVGANVQPLERSTMDSDKLSGPERGEMILTRNPYHSTDSNSMFLRSSR